MLSGAMYDDLASELVEARAEAIRLSNAFNAVWGSLKKNETRPFDAFCEASDPAPCSSRCCGWSSANLRIISY